MIYIDLIYNLTLLISLTIVSGFIEKHLGRKTRLALLLQGILFGGAAALSMMRPFHMESGIIVDGRPVMVSLCSLFFGPFAAAVSTVIAVICRLLLGGVGKISGSLIIVLATIAGLIAHYRLKPEENPPAVRNLYFFGLFAIFVSHLAIFTLPDGVWQRVLKQTTMPVMLLFPLAIVLAGKILSDQFNVTRMMNALKQSENFLNTLLNAIPIPVFYKGRDGKYLGFNTAFNNFFRGSSEHLIGKTVFDIHPPDLAELYHRKDAEIFASAKPQQYEAQVKDLQGNVYDVIFNKAVFSDSQGAISGLIGTILDITERKRAERALEESEAKIRSVLDNIGIGVSLISPDMKILELNNRMRDWFPSVDMNIHPICYRAFNDPPREEICDYCPTSVTLKDGLVHESTTQTPQAGTVRNYRIVSSPIFDTSGKVIAAIEMVEDITEKLSLESQLRQSQKMEAIGTLAGGVAHDFNNMLEVILGHSELSLEQVGPSHPLYAHLHEIRKAAERSAALTRQLLTFARKQPFAPITIDLNDTVEGMLKMLRRLIGEDIDLVWLPGSEMWPVKMDPSQIDQILANLCVNARDAIAGVGKVIIETHTISFDEDYSSEHPDFVPGDYVLLAVSDDGCGMDKNTLNKLFEPFFTTKEKGKGTGLGLATVYGIIKQSNGFINVQSEPKLGTTFRIYLPRHTATIEKIHKEKPVSIVTRGNETVLIVEDEPALLKMGRIMLEKFGYSVLTAPTPNEAIAVARERVGEINLLITDVVMPEMNGRELAENIMSFSPGLKCLFMSGYTGDVIAHHGVLDEGVNFVQKPFSMQTLSVKVREVLDKK